MKKTPNSKLKTRSKNTDKVKKAYEYKIHKLTSKEIREGRSKAHQYAL